MLSFYSFGLTALLGCECFIRMVPGCPSSRTELHRFDGTMQMKVDPERREIATSPCPAHRSNLSR